jgi:flagellar hook-basal body complex protein FliE
VKALDGLQGVQDNADGLAVKAATGDLTDVHNYTIASSEASLATDFTVALRDRAVEAFQSIMGMQI